MRAGHLVVMSGLAVLIACGGSTPTAVSSGGRPGGGPTPNATVTIQDFSFSPETVTVKVGQMVEWDNHGPSGHTATSDSSGVFNSGTLSAPGGGAYGGTAGGSFQHTFNQAGTFAYHCSLHPPSAYPNFRGVVVVTP